ncbi:ubiquitin carboxyl-terminal hydrolase 10 isoform X1 [Strongylocentrotus purpuratus]|uniref:Ubiquitin carboxyl-terminal hydrolase n=1 Tax=Strongylocentrotus purpuratus TaxID=7668 RepID=A0A7M7REG5_STRPU|nr:ubiquitin carboxyl-terminal hydrolase 10 isoform X1 [Strongylocentrotus purpuratus]
MAASAEDVTFGDFSALCLEEYLAIFQDPLQSSDVEFPWDDKSLARSTVPSAAGNVGSANCTLNQQAFLKQSTLQSTQVVGNNVAATSVLSSESPPNSFYGLANKSSKGGQVTREYPEVHSQQWVNQSAGNAATDPLDRSSAVFGGNDSQQDDSSKKRRNKKRRDPEYYNNYYDTMSGAENGSVREDSKYGGTGEYMPPSGSTEQNEYQSEAAAAPTPSYEYNADEKSTGRTSSYNMESVYQSTDYVPPRTADVSDDQQIKSDSHDESVPSSGTVIMPAVETVNIGDVNDAHANTEQGNSIASSVPSVPIIHISPSESTSPNVQSGDSFDESFPAATAEGFGGPKRAAAAPSATPPAAKSWASLFKGGSGVQSGQPSSAPYVAISVSSDPLPGEELDDGSVSLVTTDKDPHAKRLGEHLSKVMPSHHPMNLQPRGLINTANWCYINSILQALLSCPPFYHIMRNMPLNNGVRKSSSTPMLDAMYKFLKEFQEMKGLSKRSPLDIRTGTCFEPTVIYQMLSVANTSLSVKHGRQEDAEEFLSCLLNGLHDEMTSLIQLYNGEDVQANDSKQNGPASSSVAVANGDVGNGHPEEGSDDDEWEQVGPRNKTSITRKAQFSSSPLSKIFGGIMRSALHQHGSKESATLQPFFSLQLDIQSQDIWSVQHALDNLGNRESVHGFMSNKTKKEVEAFRRITLEELPPVLILHLKRFLYDKSGGCQKLMKKIEYAMEIEINKDLISPNTKSRIGLVQRTYKLFAVVYHTGKEASGGHYITDVYHVGTSAWLRCDDGIVKPVKAAQVIKPLTTCIPYLLFYRRKDLLTKPTAS